MLHPEGTRLLIRLGGISGASITNPLTPSPIIPYNKGNTQYPLFSLNKPITARLEVRALPGEPTKNTPVIDKRERWGRGG